MGYKLRAVASDSAGLGLVPDEVAKDIEEMYAFLSTHPGNELVYENDKYPEGTELDAEGNPVDKKAEPRPDEDRAKEARAFLRSAQAYGKTREAGALKIRQLPSKHLTAGTIRLQITADLEANGAREGQTGPVAGQE